MEYRPAPFCCDGSEEKEQDDEKEYRIPPAKDRLYQGCKKQCDNEGDNFQKKAGDWLLRCHESQ
jgi:hypothetical protein